MSLSRYTTLLLGSVSYAVVGGFLCSRKGVSRCLLNDCGLCLELLETTLDQKESFEVEKSAFGLCAIQNFKTYVISGGSRIFLRGGRRPRGGGGRPLPRRLRFEKFVCQNERIWTLRGGRVPAAPPPPGSANGYYTVL